MNFKRLFALLPLLTILLLSTSCARTQSGPDAGASSAAFQSCRDFPFDKWFPGKDKRPFAVHYDSDRELTTGEDGVNFKFSFRRDDPFNKRAVPWYEPYYLKELPQSEAEKRYLTAYKKRQEEFDRKYAGYIKQQLRSVTPILTNRKGEKYRPYPEYLEGAELPAGVATPASFFSPDFFMYYIEAIHKNGYLKEYILSTEIYQDAAIRDLAWRVGNMAAMQVEWRLEALYAEYILTWYYLKQYDSAEERYRTAIDLADYYSDVAFRGAAESMYNYKHLLTASQQCRIANYIAGRVYDLVMVIDQPVRLEKIKGEYKKELLATCEDNITQGRVPYPKKGVITKEEFIRRTNEIENRVRQGKETCIND